MAVRIGDRVVVGAVIGVIVGVVGRDAPAVAGDALEPEGVLHVPLLRGQAVQAVEVDHAALQQRQLRRVAVPRQVRAAQGIAVRAGAEVDGRPQADLRQRAPDGPVVVGLGAVREQVGAVDDLQPGNGLIIAVHEVQQQQLLPRGHAVGRGAGDAFEIGADGDRLTAPDGSVLPRPDLRFRYGGDGLRVLRRRGRAAGAGNRAAGGCGQGHGQQEHQQDQAFQGCVPPSL